MPTPEERARKSIDAHLLRAVDPDEVEAASRRLSASDESARAQELASYFNPLAPVEITAANLPHWQQKGVTYFVTFRLADSLPTEQLAAWRSEREAWLRNVEAASRRLSSEAKRQDAASTTTTLTPEQQAEYHRLFSGRIENWLDQGHDSEVLTLPECRQIVETALRHFDGSRYTLGEFVVASNHVHVLVSPSVGHDLSEILHSWKSFTAKEIIKVEAASRRLSAFWDELHQRRLAEQNKRQDAASTSPVAARQRPVWQKESYDHIVRSPAALDRIEVYIRGHAAWEDKRRDAASTLL